MISLKNTLKAITTSIKALSVDYIVEQGTSGIWTYRKWNSGIAECWGAHTASFSATTLWTSGLYYAYYTSMPNYPVSFLDLPTTDLTISASGANFWGYPVRDSLSKTNIGKIIFVAVGSRSNQTAKLDIYAIGRWK